MRRPLHARATACGKVILAGEHAVVFGHPALAVGIPASLVLSAEPMTPADRPSRLAIPSWGVDLDLDPASDHQVARAARAVLQTCRGPTQGWRVRGATSLPARAGLGSSAALTVALARLALGPHADVATVVDASLAGERVFHGAPSGVDSEVAARGGLLRYVRGAPPETVAMRARLRLTVVPSGRPRNTADQVHKVKRRRDRFQTVLDPTFGAIGALTDRMTAALQAGNIEPLGELFNVAHALLCAIGASSRALDQMCAIALTCGADGAKLTGAGGGGCIVCVPPPDPEPFEAALRDHGFNPLSLDLAP